MLFGDVEIEDASDSAAARDDGFRSSEQHRDDYVTALIALGGALQKLWRLDAARQHYDTCVDLLPESSFVYRNRAEVHILQRQLDLAQADLQRAVALDGDETSPHLWYRRAQIAVAQGDGSAALTHLKAVLERDASFDVHDVRAQAAWLDADFETAREALAHALADSTAGDQAALRHEFALLVSEQPDRDASVFASLLDGSG